MCVLCLSVSRLGTPSDLMNLPLTPWVIIGSSGKVECAHCTCMAGVAESCTHVGALLFKVEATVRIHGAKTVTDVPAYWVLPSNLSKIKPEVGYMIDYTSSARQKKVLDKRITVPCPFCCTLFTQTCLHLLLEKFGSTSDSITR